MTPLIDSDVLRYEIGFAAESAWQSEGFPPFDFAAQKLDLLIANICAVVGATKPPILYFTGKTNFRNNIAKTTPYKERKGYKPFHYYNLTAYAKAVYDWRELEGFEADDLMAIAQTSNPYDTIICTRDKDLRAVPGWHYGWELGNQPEFAPTCVTPLGEIRLSSDRKSIKGEGLLFFYSQCLTGDTTDSIPGCKGCGPVKAFETLDGCTTLDQAFERVLGVYKEVYGALAEDMLLEQGQLLWMTRKIDDKGEPVLWKFPTLGIGDHHHHQLATPFDVDGVSNRNSNTSNGNVESRRIPI